MKPSSQTTAYVAMIGEKPLAVAADLSVAQDNALTRQTDWAGADQWEYRWDEYLPGEGGAQKGGVSLLVGYQQQSKWLFH